MPEYFIPFERHPLYNGNWKILLKVLTLRLIFGTEIQPDPKIWPIDNGPQESLFLETISLQKELQSDYFDPVSRFSNEKCPN